MKRKRLVLIIILVAFCFTTILSAGARYSNDLVRYVARQKNKIPNRYTAPTESQISILRQAVWHTFNGEFAGATVQANAVDYTIKAFTHTNNLTYYILESKHPIHRPWGTYIFYLGDDALDTVIEIPHPKSEKNVANTGIKLFINSKAKAFLLSGSHRSKCDVAFTTAETVFQGIHERITSASTDVIQIHSFKIYSYPQIVITDGTGMAIPRIDKFVMELMGTFEVGVFDGIQYSRLGSTNNAQAQYTNSIGGNFIGIFLNRIVAQSKTKKASFIDLTETAITETTTVETPLI